MLCVPGGWCPHPFAVSLAQPRRFLPFLSFPLICRADRRTVKLQIEQIERDSCTAVRGNGGSRDALAESGSSDGGGGGYAMLQGGKRAVVGDKSLMVEQTIL